MSDSVWPHRRQPTRLPRPWDSPGKNTGVGCHFLLQCLITSQIVKKKLCWQYSVYYSCVCVCVCVSCSVMSNSLWLHGLEPARLLCPWSSPGKNAGVACHSLLQGIFLTQGSNPCLPHCRLILYCWATGEAHTMLFIQGYSYNPIIFCEDQIRED